MKSVLNEMMTVLDRLAAGDDFNAVVDETGITALVSRAQKDLTLPEAEREVAGEMMMALDRLANGEEFNDVVEETRITAIVCSALANADASKPSFRAPSM